MQIKPYENEDPDLVIDLITSIQIQEFGVATSAEKQTDLSDIPGYYQQGIGNFWLASVGDDLAGTIAIKDVGNGIAALRKMFVKKNYRGKQMGVAAALMATLLEWSGDVGVREIYLGTVDVYHAAHRFYEKNGFVEVPREQVPLSVPLMDVDVKFYCYRF
ncbi:MAG: GNAT family N-acetyltransferase [Pseudodesulfovibrio sp.]|nr:GNAT family N-acetyltransferase [Pseudodesulfovibrio sp.]